jgi:exosortase H (IPTLxxWG-CTERM-specific)
MRAFEKDTRFLSANRRALVFLLRFALIFAVSYFVFGIAPGVRNGIIQPYTEWLAKALGFVINLLGAGSVVEGTTVNSPQFAIQIAMGCDGVEPSCLFLAGVLAYPASWRAKILGLAAGIPLIHAINLVRLVVLYYAGVFVPSVVEEVHVYVAQAIVILLTTAILIYWLQRVSAPERA